MKRGQHMWADGHSVRGCVHFKRCLKCVRNILHTRLFNLWLAGQRSVLIQKLCMCLQSVMESAYPMETPKTEELQIGKKLPENPLEKLLLRCVNIWNVFYIVYFLWNTMQNHQARQASTCRRLYSVKSGTVKRWSLYTLFCLNF